MPRTSRLGIAATVAASLMLVSAPRVCAQSGSSFSFNDVHFWTGSGTNKAVVLVDFSYAGIAGGLTKSLAWGFRWNGVATQLDALRTIAADDKRFHVSGDLYPVSIAYDFDNDGGSFDHARGVKTDADDLIASGNSGGNYWNYYWATTASPNTTTYSSGGFGYCNAGANEEPVAPNSFFGIKLIPWGAEDYGDIFYDPITGDPHEAIYSGGWLVGFVGITDTPASPVAAQTPYGHVVVDLSIDVDPRFNIFSDPNAVLGRPTISDIANFEDENSPAVPVSPFVAASMPSSVLRLADRYDNPLDEDEMTSRGYVTIEFDHPVVDDPMNPWGLDFIVFGNAFYKATSGSYMSGFENPTSATVFSGIVAEPGKVAVSQDGISWHTFDSGPYADSHMPTLGLRYDPANANPNVFVGNQWWGAPTDPTFPVAPDAPSFISSGATLADISSWYKGSAGGAGFDISGLNLPATHNGRKWFKFVRITNDAPLDAFVGNDTASCEIDAVADVYPVDAYNFWAREQYSWTEQLSAAKKTAFAANGKRNFDVFARGLDPAVDAPVFSLSGFEVKDGKLFFSFETMNADLRLSDLIESGILPATQVKTALSAGWSKYNHPFSQVGISTNAFTGARTITISAPNVTGFNSLFFRFGFTAEED